MIQCCTILYFVVINIQYDQNAVLMQTTCSSLGDFDSAGTVSGLRIKEPTEFASVLLPGYQTPEVMLCL